MLGHKLLVSMITGGGVSDFYQARLTPDYFVSDELDVYLFTKNHVESFGVLPSMVTLEEKFGAFSQAPEPHAYYLDRIEHRYGFQCLNKTLQKSSDLLKKKDVAGIISAFSEVANKLTSSALRSSVVDWVKEGHNLVVAEMNKAKDGLGEGLKLGWPYLDKMTSGLVGGDILSVVGRPACLSGDTQIWVSRKKKSAGRWMSLKELYRGFSGQGAACTGKYGQTFRTRYWDLSIPTRINSLYDDGLTGLNLVEDVVYSGEKETFTVTTDTGRAIRATKDHRFLTPDGYKCLSELSVGCLVVCRAGDLGTYAPKPLSRKVKELVTKLPYSPYCTRVVSGCTYHRVTHTRLAYDANLNEVSIEDFITALKTNHNHGFLFSDSSMQVHHKDHDYNNNSPENLQLLSDVDHQLLHHAEGNYRHRLNKYAVQHESIVSISSYGVEDTYDVCMQAPYNNFVADGFVVHNSGKAQPLDASVLTMQGFLPMEDVKVGMSVASLDGSASYVTGVYPQGVKQTYEVLFKDGRKTECCGEHLWEVHCNRWHGESARVVDTLTLMQLLATPSYKDHLTVPLFSGDFGEDSPLPIDPYLLGVLIGDGGFTGGCPVISSADNFIISEINSLVLPDYQLKHRGRYDYGLIKTTPQNVWIKNKYTELLKLLGLWGCKAENKFIPDVYLNSSKEDRLSLLQGLMDTDGTVSTSCSASYSTSSSILANQTLRLIWSLGGRCKGVTTKKTMHLDNYRLHFKLPVPKNIFRLPRKKDRLPEVNAYGGSMACTIDSIRAVRKVECQCIAVSHPSHLYVTDDYLVTHNTYANLWMGYSAYKQGKRVLFLSMEMSPVSICQRMHGIHAKLDMTNFKKGFVSDIKWKSLCAGMSILSAAEGKLGNYFKIVDGNMNSRVDELAAFITQYHPDLVIVDGAYLLKHSNTKLDRFNRAAENVELLKKLSGAENVPMILSYQLNRESTKKKKIESAGLEDIAYSDAVGQISSVVLALMQPESTETTGQREVTVLKGRDGQAGKFSIHWRFDQLDFSQLDVVEEDKDHFYG